MNLFEASAQWASRPDDERFFTLEEARDVTHKYHLTAREATVQMNKLRVEAEGPEVLLMGERGIPTRLTHWAFGQLSARCGAPASYLRTLPPTLVAQNLNFGLKRANDDTKSKILVHENGSLLCRAFTSEIYGRIWNFEIFDRLINLKNMLPGWRVPPARPARPGQKGTRPATEADVLSMGGGGGLSVKVGDAIAPAGVYASDHDMFVLLINETNRIEDGSAGGLSRGVIVSNSEVGAAKFRMKFFNFRHVCGNHIIWDVSKIREIEVKHVGERVNERAWSRFAVTLREFANEGAWEIEAKIKRAKTFELAKSKDDLLDLIFKKGLMTRKQAEHAYLLAETHEDNPRSAYGFVGGVTRLSQLTPYTDERIKLEYTVKPIMEMAF